MDNFNELNIQEPEEDAVDTFEIEKSYSRRAVKLNRAVESIGDLVVIDFKVLYLEEVEFLPESDEILCNVIDIEGNKYKINCSYNRIHIIKDAADYSSMFNLFAINVL